HPADDLIRLAFEVDLAGHGAAIAAEEPLPEAVAEQRHLAAAGPHVLVGEGPAEQRLHPHHLVDGRVDQPGGTAARPARRGETAGSIRRALTRIGSVPPDSVSTFSL